MKRTGLKRKTGLQARNGIKPVRRSVVRVNYDDYQHDDHDEMPYCYLARHGVTKAGWMTVCEGQLIHAHLLPQRLLKREGHAAYLGDYRTWVYACGGLNGSCGHHGAFDTARTLRLPRAAIPEATEQLAAELGLDWYLDREYGTPDTETEAA